MDESNRVSIRRVEQIESIVFRAGKDDAVVCRFVVVVRIGGAARSV